MNIVPLLALTLPTVGCFYEEAALFMVLRFLQSMRQSNSEQHLPGGRQPHATGSSTAGSKRPTTVEAAGPLEAGLPAGRSFFPAQDEESGSDSGEDETAQAAARARRQQQHRFPRPPADAAAAAMSGPRVQQQQQSYMLSTAAEASSSGAITEQTLAAGAAASPEAEPSSYYMPVLDRPSLLDLPMSLPAAAMSPAASGTLSSTSNGALKPLHSLLDIDWSVAVTPMADQEDAAASFAPAAVLPLSEASSSLPMPSPGSGKAQKVPRPHLLSCLKYTRPLPSVSGDTNWHCILKHNGLLVHSVAAGQQRRAAAGIERGCSSPAAT